jgi:Protein of unknown function (DUF2975)
MKPVPLISKLFFYGTNILGLLYLLTFAHSAIAFLFKTASLNIVEEGTRFEIFYPFTRKPFLLGDYNVPYIVLEFVGMLFFYGMFLLLLSLVFHTFSQAKLFTQEGYNRLKRFYLFNFIVPTLGFIGERLNGRVDGTVTTIVLLHFVIGIFAFFLAAIFKQGLTLQMEQDLII